MLRVWLLGTYALLAVAMLLAVAGSMWPDRGARPPDGERTGLLRLARLWQLAAALAGLAACVWQATSLAR